MNASAIRPSKARMGKPLAVLMAFLACVCVAGSAYALNEGARAPEIGLRSLNGANVTLASLRDKVVVVDFWASWCAPCREEFPFLERLHRSYGSQGLAIVGVSVDREVGNVQTFLRRTPASFTIVHDAAHAVADRYHPTTMPTSYILDRRGVVRHVHAGFRARDAETIEREVQALLQAR